MNTAIKCTAALLQIIGGVLMWSGLGKSARDIAEECEIRLGGDTIEETMELPHVKARVREHRRAQWGAALMAAGGVLAVF